jgi:hypothetical protein
MAMNTRKIMLALAIVLTSGGIGHKAMAPTSTSPTAYRMRTPRRVR